MPVTLEILIIYAHRDEALKQVFQSHLAGLRHPDIAMTWEAQAVDRETRNHLPLHHAVEHCDIALLLLSADLLASDFMRSASLVRLLDRQSQGETRVALILSRPCAWQQHALRELPLFPEDGRAVSGFSEAGGEREAIWQHIVEQLAHWLGNLSLAQPKIAGRDDPPQVDLSCLPVFSHPLLGRGPVLNLLERSFYSQEVNLVSVIAGGGMGKSAVLREWLNRLAPAYGGARKIFGWSFFSQGNSDFRASSHLFFERALSFFGHQGALPDSEDAKVHRLLALIRRQPAILVLDGAQPLQYLPHHRRGEFADMGLKTLLLALRAQNLGPQRLIVIASRQPLVEMGSSQAGSGYRSVTLEPLNPGEGANLLDGLGVSGSLWELTALSKAYAGFPLALDLLGHLLREQYQGAREAAEHLPPLRGDDRRGAQARRLLDHYRQTLWPPGSPQQAFLSLVSLVDRPLARAEFQTLLQRAELGRPLAALSGQEQLEVDRELSRAGLLLESPDCPEWKRDTHPMIRAYFAEYLAAGQPAAWQQAHHVLFEYFRTREMPGKAERVSDLEHWYRAIGHGCLAGQANEALNAVFRQHIYSRELPFNTHAMNLAALACFYPDGWQHSPVEGLGESEQAWVLEQAADCLYRLGQLEEATAPAWEAVRLKERRADQQGAANMAGKLVELLLPLGQLEEAWQAASQAQQWAENAADPESRRRQQVRLGHALHRLGRLRESRTLFDQLLPAEPVLLTAREEAAYLGLMLDMHGDAETLNSLLERAERLVTAQTEHDNFSRALAYLSRARVYLALQHFPGTDHDLHRAREYLEREPSPPVADLPEFLLNQAWFRRRLRQLDSARQALDSLLTLVTRCGMRLYEVDARLLQGNLLLDAAFCRGMGAESVLPPRLGLRGAGELLEEVENLHQQATNLVEAMHYESRLGDLALLAARLAYHARHGVEARAHLEAARRYIESSGQKGLLLAWEQVAMELGQ